ncbi:winged helix-turn-helix domain-containing protein, partial [bacterium]|nr:winged helix-turn-helix domain-containing protein [bacterium]
MPDNRYLRAAKEVLLQYGKPMHYQTLTRMAMKTGHLDTNAQYPEVAMSTILSNDIRKNPNSIFKKERLGVFALSDTLRNITEYRQFGNRVLQLSQALGLPEKLSVVKRALYV